MPSPTPTIDASLFPATAAYLARLPDGINSFPQCETRREYNDIILKEFPKDPKHPKLPPDIAKAIAFSTDKRGWVPDTHCLVHMHVVLDLHFGTPEKFFARHFQWTREMTADVYYRAAMYCVSPALTMIAAGALWSRSSRGTTAVSREGPIPKSRFFTLNFPLGMYDRFNVEAVFVSGKAIITQPSGKDIKYEIIEIGESSGTCLYTW